jgi:hypothetical protein
VLQANGGGGPPILVRSLEVGPRQAYYIKLKLAMHKGEGNKAPGRDGMGFEFLKATWNALKDDTLDLFTEIFANNNI